MALAPRRRARRVFAYWRSEKRTLRQGFVALLLSAVTSLVAGITLASITDTLDRLPGLLILVPAVLGMRGTIFGAMGARLGTATHAGLFEVTLRRTGVLYQNIFAAVVMTLSSALYLAALAKLSAVAFGLRSISFFDYVTISVLGGVIDSAIILALTIGLSVLSYRRGYDLDTVSTPLVTAAADMATVPILFLATFATRVGALNTTIAVSAIVLCLFATIRGVYTDLPIARRAQIEMAATIMLTPILDILAGTVAQSRQPLLNANPALLVVLPAFVGTAGSLGGILCARLSSKLQLGVLSPRGRPEALALLDGSLIVGFGASAFTVVATISLLYSVIANLHYPSIATMLAGTVLAGLIATFIAIGVGYYVAIATTRLGWNPDNHTVPIITSVMDLAGTFVFILVIFLFGVSVHG